MSITLLFQPPWKVQSQTMTLCSSSSLVMLSFLRQLLVLNLFPVHRQKKRTLLTPFKETHLNPNDLVYLCKKKGNSSISAGTPPTVENWSDDSGQYCDLSMWYLELAGRHLINESVDSRHPMTSSEGGFRYMLRVQMPAQMQVWKGV